MITVFDVSMIDESGTQIKELTITEDHYSDKAYEYKCTYDVYMKFKNVKTDNPRFNQFCDSEIFRGKGVEVRNSDKRVDDLNGIVTPEDDKAGTVDEAIQDYIDTQCKTLKEKFKFVLGVVSLDIPKKVFDDAYNGKMELVRDVKVTGIDYDYRKMAINRVTVYYEDDSSLTVETNHEITNRNVQLVIPDMSLITVYNNVEDWLEEDYEGTLNILKEIFGFDLVTLKGVREVL